MSDRRRYSVVRDPVHGDVYLSDEELKLLDTPQMQRLRGVRQLGTAYLVYPGAQHTRFEHSLGTMHLTSRLIAAVNQNRSLRPEGLLGIARDEERILRAAALVHDVTHIPSGHNIEDVRGILDRHDSAERYQQALAPATDVGAALEKMGIRREVEMVLLPDGEGTAAAAAASDAPAHPRLEELFGLVFDAYEQLRRQEFSPIWGSMIKQQIKRGRSDFSEADYGYKNFAAFLEAARKAGRIDFTVDRQSGAAVVTSVRRRGEGPPPAPAPPRVPACWRELLSDTICPDILDYLKRDAWFTGLSLVYDERILSYFMVDRASGHLFVDVEKRGMLREDILSELLRVLDARYFFSERVYYHHAKVAAGAMIAQVVETALLHGGLAKEQLYEQTDHSLLGLLERHVQAPPPVPPAAAAAAGGGPLFTPAVGEAAEEIARARELLARLKSRRLLKRACVYPLYANRDVQEELLERFFAPGRHGERKAFEREIREELRRAGFEPPLVQLYCPARKMQLKEAATHVRFPGADGIAPLAKFADRVPRLADLEKSYRDLWKLYLFAGSEEPALLTKIAELAAKLLPKATNVYRLKP